MTVCVQSSHISIDLAVLFVAIFGVLWTYVQAATDPGPGDKRV
jgi:hypothetical protein